MRRERDTSPHDAGGDNVPLLAFTEAVRVHLALIEALPGITKRRSVHDAFGVAADTTEGGATGTRRHGSRLL